MAPKKRIVDTIVDTVSNLGTSADEREQERQDQLKADFESRVALAQETEITEDKKPVVAMRDTGAIEKEKGALIEQGATEKQAAARVGQKRIETGQGFTQPTNRTIEEVTQARKALLERKATPQQIQLLKGQGAFGAAQLGVAGVGGAIAGAGTGAAIGSIVPGPGTAIGGVVGGSLGFIGGLLTKLGVEKRQDVKTVKAAYLASVSNMGNLLQRANSGLEDPIALAIEWDRTVALYRESQKQIHILNKDVNRFVSGGADEEQTINEFETRLGGLEFQFNTALINPNPNAQAMNLLSQDETFNNG